MKYIKRLICLSNIIAAGSLLGVALNREKYSFPVGKVDILTMYPLDFEEFLWAIGKKDLADMVRECYNNNEEFSLHETAMQLYRLYLLVGGMPKVILDYIETKDFNFVIASQKSLNDSYIAEIHILLIWQNTQHHMKQQKL